MEKEKREQAIQLHEIKPNPKGIPVVLREGEEVHLPSFNNLQNFVREAATAKIHLNIPRIGNQSPQQWADQWNWLGTYVFTDATHNDIADKYHTKKQSVHRKVVLAAKRLHVASPKELKEKYPLESFVFSKPMTEKTLYRISKATGAKLKEAIQMAKSGKSAQEIKDKLGISSDQLKKYSLSAKQIGVNIGDVRQIMPIKYIEILNDTSLNFEESQKLLSRVKKGNTFPPDSPVIKIAPLIRKAGLIIEGRRDGLTKVVDTLRARGIPVGIIERKIENHTQRYGIAIRKDIDNIVQVLDKDPALAKLRSQPVTFIGNHTSGKLPSTFELSKSGEFQAVTTMLGSELLHEKNKRKLTFRDLFDDSIQFAIYFDSRGVHARKKDRDAIRAYVESKLAGSETR